MIGIYINGLKSKTKEGIPPVAFILDMVKKCHVGFFVPESENPFILYKDNNVNHLLSFVNPSCSIKIKITPIAVKPKRLGRQ